MYRILFTTIDKKTGECIGKGQSCEAYDSVEDAKKDVDIFEFENEGYKQEVTGIGYYVYNELKYNYILQKGELIDGRRYENVSRV